MAAGWRRSKIRGSRPGNFSKLSTGKLISKKYFLKCWPIKSNDYQYFIWIGGTLDFEDEEEENDSDWASSKDKDSHTFASINNALRASLEQVVSNTVKNSSAKNSKAVSKNKRLTHLNGIVKLWNIKNDLEKSKSRSPSKDEEIKDGSEDSGKDTIVGSQSIDWEQCLHLRELLLCLRVPLIHESSDIRASTLRTIRQLLTEPEHVNMIQEINLHYLIARSLDIDASKSVRIFIFGRSPIRLIFFFFIFKIKSSTC